MMLRMSNIEEKVVALLHDVIEDRMVTEEELAERGFPPEVVAGVVAMSRNADESYEAFIERAAANPIARRVKLADVEDNLDLRRLVELTDRDVARLRKYMTAHRCLSRAAD
jgi:(p)ppGpp synthase/HD superfamily hydrolase